MPTVVITGANRGIGLEAAAQFARSGRFSTVILTVRSADKGPAAVAAAATASGRPASLFTFQALDLEDHASVRAAIAALPDRLDALVLNAGGLGGTRLTAHGVTVNFAQNVLGHAVLTEGLLAAGKLGAGAKVIYSHSETTRSVWLFTGMQPFVRLAVEDIEGSIARPPTRGSYGVPVRGRMNAYANSKLIGGLWLRQLAEEHPGIYFASVSPGGVATDVYADAPQPLPFLMSQSIVVKMFLMLRGCHPVEAAAERYVTAVTDETFKERFPSGSVLGGPSGFPNYGATGPLVDQGEYSSYYYDAALQKEAARVVRLAAAVPHSDAKRTDTGQALFNSSDLLDTALLTMVIGVCAHFFF